MELIYRKYLKMGVFVWAGCFIVFLLFYLLVLVPQEKLRASVEERFVETKRIADAAREAAKEERKIELSNQVENLDKRLKGFVTEQEETANLTFDISQISSDIKLRSFSITATGSEGIIEIDNCDYIFAKHIDITFVSSFNQFASFLNALERWRPVIFIDTFSIKRSRQSASGHEVGMKLAVLVGKDVRAKEVGS